MANENGFGGITYTQSYSDRYVYTDGIGLPTGRAAANGDQHCLITAVRANASGRGAARSMSISIGSVTTGSFSVGAAGSAQNTGWKAIGPYRVQGGSVRFTLNLTGSTYFASLATGNSYDDDGNHYGQIAGGYQWAQAPSPAKFNNITPQLDGTIDVSIGGPSDDGGSGLIGFQAQWSTSSNFSSGVTTSNRNMTASGVNFTVSNLSAGDKYYFRVAARNAVTDSGDTVGPWSPVTAVTVAGPPSVPRSFTVAQVPTSLDTVKLDWVTPADTAGGITGYDIWNNGTRYVSLVGTDTEAVLSGLTKNATYSWYVRARNAWVDSAKKYAAADPTPNIPYTNWSSSSAAQNLTAVAHPTIPARIGLSWQPPTDVGQGVTKYAIYQSTGALVTTIPATQTTYNVDGLTPNTYYAFYVLAYTAISEAAGNADNKSNTAGTTALGDPSVPSNLSVSASTLVPDRLTLSWAQAGSYTGFYIFRANTDGSYTQLGTVSGTKFVVDNLLGTGPYSFAVAARNTITDSRNTYGPMSSIATGSPSRASQQTVAPTVVTDTTNVLYNGAYQITATTATTMNYARTSVVDYKTTTVSSGTVTNASNAALSGTHVITSLPSANTFTFTFTSSGYDIPEKTAVTGVTATNLTSQQFIKTAASPAAVTAVNVNNSTLSYAATGADVSSRAVSLSTVTNLSNAVFNGTGITITGLTNNTLQYPKTYADQPEVPVTGSIINTTNRDVYNTAQNSSGSVTVLDTPAYNSFTYVQGSATQAKTSPLDVLGEAHRATSKAVITIKYRSGWAG